MMNRVNKAESTHIYSTELLTSSAWKVMIYFSSPMDCRKPSIEVSACAKTCGTLEEKKKKKQQQQAHLCASEVYFGTAMTFQFISFG